ncbi:TPA: ankyrin repeat domain-containing protein [Serratia fonticola]
MEYFSKNNLDIYQVIENEDILTLNALFEKEPLSLNTLFLGDSLLHLAARKGKVNLCDFLIKKGADVNSLSDGYLTPLIESACEGYLDVVTLLIESGALVNGDPRCVTTPLIESSMYGHLGVVRVLVDSNADINRLQANFNRTALDIAMAYKHEDIASYLQSVGARKAYEEIDIEIPGGGILHHIYNNVGPILVDEYHDDGVSLKTATIGDGKSHKLLFTFGNFVKVPHTEFLICLPYNWPLNNSIFNGGYKESFPFKLLCALSNKYKHNGEIKEGYIIDKHGDIWAGLDWPESIDALISVDYSFEHKDKELSSSDEEPVTLFLLVPIKYAKTGVPKGNKFNEWVSKRRTASWKSVSFKNEWLG